jgi:hypothetical protein
MLATATMPHINRHFRFAQRDVSGRCVVVPGPQVILLVGYSGHSGLVYVTALAAGLQSKGEATSG